LAAGSAKLPTNGAAALLQPLLGIAVLAVGLKIPGLMGGALAGGNVVSTVAGVATGAAVGMGTRALTGLALRGGGAAAPAAASTRPGAPAASQVSLPLSAGVAVGRGAEQAPLPLSVAHSA
jgi:hypothetical protein